MLTRRQAASFLDRESNAWVLVGKGDGESLVVERHRYPVTTGQESYIQTQGETHHPAQTRRFHLWDYGTPS